MGSPSVAIIDQVHDWRTVYTVGQGSTRATRCATVTPKGDGQSVATQLKREHTAKAESAIVEFRIIRALQVWKGSQMTPHCVEVRWRGFRTL